MADMVVFMAPQVLEVKLTDVLVALEDMSSEKAAALRQKAHTVARRIYQVRLSVL